MKPVGPAVGDNGHHLVQAYPSYGPGRNGWRLAVVKAGNALAKAGSAGYWGWLVSTARGVNPVDLLHPLPDDL